MLTLILKYKNLIMPGIIVLLVLALSGVGKYALNQRAEKSRYEHNYTTLKDGLTYYETKDGQVYGKGGVLELKLKDLNKAEFDSMKSELKKFDVKLRNVQTITRDSVKTSNNFNVFVRDTLLYDSVKAQVAKWKDPWTSFSYVKLERSDSAQVAYSTQLDLLQVISKEPRGWNLFSSKFWSKRHLQQTITTSNPHAKIGYSKIIEIQK